MNTFLKDYYSEYASNIKPSWLFENLTKLYEILLETNKKVEEL